mmetsp:Transcript_8292/g.16077  ORF Transcript_8292/g.16077 Transcript_8292/m.16077 type:complete len:925 (+) Transcript_8292:81-2855(+)
MPIPIPIPIVDLSKSIPSRPFVVLVSQLSPFCFFRLQCCHGGNPKRSPLSKHFDCRQQQQQQQEQVIDTIELESIIMSGNNDSDGIDDLRQKGNHEFQQGNLEHAISFYTSAIEIASRATDEASADADATVGDDNTVPVRVAFASHAQSYIVNLCNRSACYFQMEDLEKAKADAELAWKASNESNVKSAYRLAKTMIALKEFENVIQVLKTALEIRDLKETEAKSLQELGRQALIKMDEHERQQHILSQGDETSVRFAQRPLSIREFKKSQTLGVGNFSEIIVVQHKVTKEEFALKILEKKTAADLAKRQHPNVYNEIAMERKVLLERVPHHPNIINMYHAFRDFNNLYYLMDLHNVNPDLWTQLRYRGKMVGAPETSVKRWMMQLVDALEHLHLHGIVHRDIKPENVLVNKHNHVVVIDFGTAKDLIQTDLNGPEFVGTPDFMAPEAVTGFSGMPNQPGGKSIEKGAAPATAATDLWALGAMAYILHTGSTPFWSPSPYLTFLRIKRGLLPRNTWGIPDDDAWDFISKLMRVKQEDRLGADCFEVKSNKVRIKGKGYDILRSHEYFATVDRYDKSSILPSLQDLCIRACAELAKQDAMDLDVCDQHPPGDGSKHDLNRLSPRQRNLVCHVLDKSKAFSHGDETRIYQRFFASDIDYIRAKVRPASRDFVGLTQMNDNEYKPLTGRGSADPYATKIEPEPTKIVVLTNPMLLGGKDITPEQEKRYLKGWKNCISIINKKRPKAVIVCAKVIPPKFWKFLARIRDSIPVIWNDGSVHYSFWLNGFQGLILQSSELRDETSSHMLWLREQMEQARMSKQQLFCFCDCDPGDLSPMVQKRLARGRSLCLVGLSNTGNPIDCKIKYSANETLDDDDNTSVKSTESLEDEDDRATMRVYGTTMNGLRWITVDEQEEWYSEFEAVEMPTS